MSYTDYLSRIKTIRTNIVSFLNGFNIVASTTETLTQLVAKFSQVATDTTAIAEEIMIGKTAYLNGTKVTGTYSDGIVPLVNSITVSGTYSDATYQTFAGAFYCQDGKLAIIMKSGTSTTYENLNFSLSSAPSGISLLGQSVCTYSGASTGMYYVAIISGVTKKINVAIDMSSRNSSYDYVQCAITITEVAES